MTEPVSKEERKAMMQSLYTQTLQRKEEELKTILDHTALFDRYLEVQARFLTLRAGNAAILAAQKPESTMIKQVSDWNAEGGRIRKGAKGIRLLTSREYTRRDGTAGIREGTMCVFDISQTDLPPLQETQFPETEILLPALLETGGVRIAFTDRMPEGMDARYRPEEHTVFLRDGLTGGALFAGLAREKAHAYLHDLCGSRREAYAPAACAAALLGRVYGICDPEETLDPIVTQLRSVPLSEAEEQLNLGRVTCMRFLDEIAQYLQQEKDTVEAVI